MSFWIVFRLTFYGHDQPPEIIPLVERFMDREQAAEAARVEATKNPGLVYYLAEVASFVEACVVTAEARELAAADLEKALASPQPPLRQPRPRRGRPAPPLPQPIYVGAPPRYANIFNADNYLAQRAAAEQIPDVPLGLGHANDLEPEDEDEENA